MYPRKAKDSHLENLMNEYLKKKTLFSHGHIKENKSSTSEQNETIYQKNNNIKIPLFEFKTFCAMTGLHGFLHFVKNNFNKYGKTFWAICLVAIYILCGVSIYILIFSFRERPAILSLDNSASSIWKIPFPAITVCSSNKIRPSVYNKLNINITNSDDQLFRSTVHGICENNRLLKKETRLSEKYIDGSFVTQVLKNMSFPCKDLITGIIWIRTNENDPCNSSWIQETFTSYGLCYSFNMIPMGELLNGVDEWSQEQNLSWLNHRSNWQPDTGYDDDELVNNNNNNNLPMRMFGNGDANSVNIHLNIHSEDLDEECAQGMSVFYILVHSPAEWPDISHPTFVSSSNSMTTMIVRPIVLTTSSDLTSWDAQSRRCYFQNEKKLKFFKVYTQKNCILECQSDNVLTQCGCVPFYHIRMKNTPVCGPAKISCFATVSQSSTDYCNCLPGCSELTFKILPTNAPLFKNTEVLNKKLSDSLLLTVYYRNKNYIGINRIMTFTFGQFMGNVGGIMGLCLGFSFLSLVEIFYFLTLRPLGNYFNSKKKSKTIKPIDNIKNNTFPYIE